VIFHYTADCRFSSAASRTSERKAHLSLLPTNKELPRGECLFGGPYYLLYFANPTTNVTAALAGSVTFFTVAGGNTRNELSAVAVTSGAENTPLAVTFRT
jgi:hypothetical protein